jgi:hypothetical protein
LRTPLTTARRVGIPHLPTGKTPLHNSTMKTRAQQKQSQTTKRSNMDITPSTIITPIKQRRLIEQIVNTTENSSTPGKRPLVKRAIPTPIRSHR